MNMSNKTYLCLFSLFYSFYFVFASKQVHKYHLGEIFAVTQGNFFYWCQSAFKEAVSYLSLSVLSLSRSFSFKSAVTQQKKKKYGQQ